MDGPIDVTISEVGPRDGLQNIHRAMPTETKIRWIKALADAGLREIEVASFVPPKLLPQMADAADVVRAARQIPGLKVLALAPNLRGAESAAWRQERIRSACRFRPRGRTVWRTSANRRRKRLKRFAECGCSSMTCLRRAGRRWRLGFRRRSDARFRASFPRTSSCSLPECWRWLERSRSGCPMALAMRIRCRCDGCLPR